MVFFYSMETKTINVIFVGDKPSSKNNNPSVPFEGTQSGKRLNRWVNYLSSELMNENNLKLVCYYVNSNSFYELVKFNNKYHTLGNPTVVVLGNVTAKAIKEHFNVGFYKMEHPSPKNRRWNVPEQELMDVKNLLDYIVYMGGTKCLKD